MRIFNRTFWDKFKETRDIASVRAYSLPWTGMDFTTITIRRSSPLFLMAQCLHRSFHDPAIRVITQHGTHISSGYSWEFKVQSSDNMWIKTDKRISCLLEMSSLTLFYPSATLLSLTRVFAFRFFLLGKDENFAQV